MNTENRMMNTDQAELPEALLCPYRCLSVFIGVHRCSAFGFPIIGSGAGPVAEAEGPLRGRPLQVIGPQRRPHPHRAGPGVAPVGEEGGGVLDHRVFDGRLGLVDLSEVRIEERRTLEFWFLRLI